MLSKAISITAKAFEGKLDKGGNPYILHCLRVMNSVDQKDSEIMQVIMWLYEKHGIWIQVSISRYGKFYCNTLKKENTKSLDNPISWEMQSQLNDFNSPTEAYSKAIEYTLINLI